MSVDANCSRWQRHKKTIWMLIALVFCIGFAVFVMCAYTFQFGWTGFNAFQGPNVRQYQASKTLWDWLQLLFVPVVLSIAAYWFNRVNSQREQSLTAQRDETERSIALDNQRATLLQDYLDRMSDLLIGQKFHNPQTQMEAQNIARARTLIVLPHLDDERKGRLIQFLYESRLLASNTSTRIKIRNADMREADLRGFDLSGADLSGANLNHAKLSGANLSEAQLQETCFHEADLSGAILRNANLHNADLSEATLNGALLQEANLLQANLSYASLSRTDLTRADFSEAIVTGAVLDQALLDGTVISQAQLSKMQKSKINTL